MYMLIVSLFIGVKTNRKSFMWYEHEEIINFNYGRKNMINNLINIGSFQTIMNYTTNYMEKQINVYQ